MPSQPLRLYQGEEEEEEEEEEEDFIFFFLEKINMQRD